MGKVILAGAGPGDPDLITIKAAKYLAKANVIITDRLVSKEIIIRYAHKDAEIIEAGKKGHSNNSTRQPEINQMIRNFYRPGCILVRLKGGDTAFFSNILDELYTLREHNIPYEIIPGITAASGASAYCGIPLTARGLSNSVRFITHYRKHEQPATYWQELAQTDDTLVCYMSGEQLLSVLTQLRQHGIDHQKAIAVIEQATTPMQKTTVYHFADLPYAQYNFQSPTLIIIGKVVNLHPLFRWKENSGQTIPYFNESIGEYPLSYFACH